MTDGPGAGGRSTRAYLMEIAVIVFSILLAFALDQGYDALTERREERVALEGLREDFLENREEVTYQMERTAVTRASFEEALVAISGPVTPADTLPWESFIGIFSSNSLDPYTATLDQLESAGKMDLLRDAELRGLLARWRAETEDARNEQIRFVDLMGASLWPALAEAGYAYPQMWEELPPPPRQRPAARALGTPKIEATFRQMTVRIRFATRDLEEARDATEAVIARLELLLGM